MFIGFAHFGMSKCAGSLYANFVGRALGTYGNLWELT